MQTQRRAGGPCQGLRTMPHAPARGPPDPPAMSAHAAVTTNAARRDEPARRVRQSGFPGLRTSFGIDGGRAAGERFLDTLKLFTRLVNIGGAKSLATRPASTTHRPLAPAELAAAGVSKDMVRLSIGIEDAVDLIEDPDQALPAACLRAAASGASPAVCGGDAPVTPARRGPSPAGRSSGRCGRSRSRAGSLRR